MVPAPGPAPVVLVGEVGERESTAEPSNVMVLPFKAGNVLAESIPLSVSVSVVGTLKSKYHFWLLEGNVIESEVACLSMVIVETGSFRLYRLLPKKLIFTSFPVPVFCEATKWVDGTSPP